MNPQPLLHDLVPTVAAPTVALSGADGQIRPAGVQGVFHSDARVLSAAVLRLDDREPEPLGHTPEGPGFAAPSGGAGAGNSTADRFVSLPRWLGDQGIDPTVRIDRVRRVAPGRVEEWIELSSTASVPVSTLLTVELAVDLAPIEVVKSGGSGEPVAPKAGDGSLTWTRDRLTITAVGRDATVDPAGRLRWAIEVPPGGRTIVVWDLDVDDPDVVARPAAGPPTWSRPEIRAADHRLTRLVDRSLDDLATLRLTDGDAGADKSEYLGAGVPWYLTLFGRDSIWAARMLLPLGTELAAGTLKVLARRQGAKVDERSGEAPGKILHEVRRHEFVVERSGLRLPPVYYGTIDATPLWISLLHDAWRWGMPAAEVEALLPNLEAALGWLADYADPDGDGFLEYVDTTGSGLANQGWKDSADAVRFWDGRTAEPPIALCEVQGYAYRAAVDGAALLDAYRRPGGDRWRTYAAELADRFRSAFWVDGRAEGRVDGGVDGGYPALALDRDKRPVDSLTSNIGHLLGTGLLTADEERAVATALAGDAMSGGYGLRTMSTLDAAFAPLSYHCGSVWAHDTAIVTAGLARAGYPDAARTLIDGLLAAAETFDYRMPELHAGDARAELSRPMPYPAACRPQAWSAAASILLLRSVLGLEPDVPNERVSLRPMAGMPVEARGLRIGGRRVAVRVDADGAGELSVEQ